MDSQILEQTLPNRWVRTKTGIISGVCEGLARQFEMEAWLMRFIWTVSILFSFGTTLLLYIILTIALPREDKTVEAKEKMILGVCARIARRGDIEIGLARLLAIILLLLSMGSAIVGYIVLYFLLPDPRTKITLNS